MLLIYQNEINSSILELNQKIALLEQNATSEIQNITALYDESIAKVENQAIKAGLINSSIVADKTAVLEEGKIQKIALITQEKDNKKASLLAEIESLNFKLDNEEAYFSQIHQSEIDAKVIELTDKQEQKKMEVFKYNNSLDEKEQRYANTIKESKCSLRLRFLDISSGEYTKDQLIDMGYYLGIGGVITFKNCKLAEHLVGIPLERLILETDAPYMAPVPHRGKRNESRWMWHVAERLAEVYNCSIEHIDEVTTANARALFVRKL